MEFASLIGDLEIRRSLRGGRRKLRGRVKYRSRATLSDGGRKGGRPQKEEFMPGAFTHSITNPDQEQSLLVGHDFDKPLAKKSNGTLIFNDTPEALTFEAEITPEIAATSYGSDILAQVDAGLTTGASVGFRLPPPRAVKNAEKFIDEGHDPALGMHNALIRQIFQAVLFEISVVHRPAYKDATVALDPEDMTDEEKLAAGWVYKNGILVPPDADQLIKRAMPAALRWR